MPALLLQGTAETGYEVNAGAMMNIIFVHVLGGSFEILVICKVSQ